MNAPKSPISSEVVAQDRAQSGAPALDNGSSDDHRHLVGARLGHPLRRWSGLVEIMRLRGCWVRFRLPRLCGDLHAPHVHGIERAIRLQGHLAQRTALPLQGLRRLVPQPRSQPGHRTTAGDPSAARSAGAPRPCSPCTSASSSRPRARCLAYRASSDELAPRQPESRRRLGRGAAHRAPS